ncbi:MAG TPA: MopE-related protein [Polyangiaceae bacterium]|nr:MopE-related protein [Polyangiaceae bacterium]
MTKLSGLAGAALFVVGCSAGGDPNNRAGQEQTGTVSQAQVTGAPNAFDVTFRIVSVTPGDQGNARINVQTGPMYTKLGGVTFPPTNGQPPAFFACDSTVNSQTCLTDGAEYYPEPWKQQALTCPAPNHIPPVGICARFGQDLYLDQGRWLHKTIFQPTSNNPVPLVVEFKGLGDWVGDGSVLDASITMNLDPMTGVATPVSSFPPQAIQKVENNCVYFYTSLFNPPKICWAVDATPRVCAPQGTDTTCDGIDDDCDGSNDEDFVPTSSACGLPGICQGSQQTTCVSGNLVTGACTGGSQPQSSDPCNGQDDNCNGIVDEDPVPPGSGGTCGPPGTCAGTLVAMCTNGSVVDTCTGVSAPQPEVLDGKDNDCDGQIDNCAPGQNDWWCQCTPGTDLVFQVDRTDDGSNADAEAANCLPGSASTGNCRLRGVFRRAEQAASLKCRIVANLGSKIYHTDAELRLGSGNLLVQGVTSDGTVLTTTQACADASCSALNCPDFGCGTECNLVSTHRLINAFADNGSTPFLELNSLTLRGGRSTDQAVANVESAAGGVVVSGGGLTLNHAIVRDNRTHGFGVGVTVADAQFLTVTDSVIRDNFNSQALPEPSKPIAECHAGGAAGGLTGQGGGIYVNNVVSTTITRSAVVRNFASDGGGIVKLGPGTLSVVNSTVSQNEAAGQGGGIRVAGGNASIQFSSVIGNIAGNGGTITSDGKFGAGIDVQEFPNGTPTSFAVFGSIFAENTFSTKCSTCSTHAPDCHVESGVDVTPSSVGLNLIGSGGLDCAALGNPATDPLIGDANGKVPAGASVVPATGAINSVTQVSALQSGSLAIAAYPVDAALPAGAPLCLLTDQRTFIRPPAGRCSLGAYEFNGLPDSDGDGIPDQSDPQPFVYSNDFNDLSSYGVTSGTITARGDQKLYLYDLGQPQGVTVEAIPGGGPTSAQVTACNGSVQVSVAAGETKTINCPRPTSCVFASQALAELDRSRIYADVFSNGFSTSSGGGITGNVLSQGNGFLGNGSTIVGNATLHGLLSGNRAGVSGSLVERATVPAQSLIVRSITSTGPNTQVPSGTTVPIPPGAYGNVTVLSSGTLSLSAGAYRFASLQFDPGAKLRTSVAHELVAVQGNLTLNDRFNVVGGGQVDFFVNGSTVTVGHDAILTANLEAPFATVAVQDRAYLSGCLGGRTVNIGQDVKIGNALAPRPLP